MLHRISVLLLLRPAGILWRRTVAASWKGFLTFGMISIPIELSPAARSERISFNQLHSVCHSRLKQPLYCPTCEKFVERSEIEKGYEYEKDQYLLFKQEELDEIEPDSAQAMEILSFVKAAEIDPVYFDASYYAKPAEAGVRAYNLLLDAMRKTGYAGIAKVTMHNRENIVIIRARDNGMTLHTMFYNNEIRAAAEASAPNKADVKEAESKLEKLIEAKAHGKKMTVMPKTKRAPVVDLMSALQQSLKAKAAGQKNLLRSVPKSLEKEKKSRKAS